MINPIQRPDWLSTFIVIDAFFVSGLILTDLFLGKAGRAQLRNGLADFWVQLNEMSFQGVTERQITLVDALFNTYVGSRFSSIRYWLAATFWNTLLVSCAYLWVLRQNVPGSQQEQDVIILQSWAAPGILRTMFLVGITGVLLIANAAMAVTHRSIRVLMSRISRARFTGAIVTVMALAAFVIIAGLVFDMHRFAFPAGTVGTAVLSAVAVSFVALLWPTVLGLLLAVAILSRAVVPHFKAPVTLVVERLAESEQGVLTTLSVVLGSVAALLELYFSN